MEIHVYMSNGRIHVFAQPDVRKAQAMLAEMQLPRLFGGGSSLILGSGANCTILRPDAISRVDVLTDQPLAIQPTIRDSARVMDNEEMFNLRAKAAIKALGDGVAPGEAYQGYMRFESSGGHCLLIELERVLAQQSQFFANLHRLLDGQAIVFPHPKGGAVVLNVANIVSVSAAPGFAEYPKGTLLVDAC